MTDDYIIETLGTFGIKQPLIEFLRHNENKTYKITDLIKGNSYLFRIHQSITKI